MICFPLGSFDSMLPQVHIYWVQICLYCIVYNSQKTIRVSSMNNLCWADFGSSFVFRFYFIFSLFTPFFFIGTVGIRSNTMTLSIVFNVYIIQVECGRHFPFSLALREGGWERVRLSERGWGLRRCWQRLNEFLRISNVYVQNATIS